MLSTINTSYDLYVVQTQISLLKLIIAWRISQARKTEVKRLTKDRKSYFQRS